MKKWNEIEIEALIYKAVLRFVGFDIKIVYPIIEGELCWALVRNGSFYIKNIELYLIENCSQLLIKVEGPAHNQNIELLIAW